MMYPPGKQDDQFISRRRLLAAGSSFAAAFAAGLSLRSSESIAATGPGKPAIVGWNGGLETLCAALMGTIIPEDETPGAISVGGPVFLELVLRDLFAPTDRDAFVSGLKTLRAILEEQAGLSFAILPADRRAKELALFEAETFLTMSQGTGATAAQTSYLQLKEITLVAFFTSQKIATTLLDFTPVPGHYIPDLPIAEQAHTDYEDSGAYGAHRYAGKLP